jgi:hypothetical protein
LKQLNLLLLTPAPLGLPTDKQQELEGALTELLLGAAGAHDLLEEKGVEDES